MFNLTNFPLKFMRTFLLVAFLVLLILSGSFYTPVGAQGDGIRWGVVV